MNSVAVSVIVPMYKGEQTISEALQSLLDQNFKEMEILVFDDGSPDKCAEIVETMRRKTGDTRLILHRHSNRGLAGTLNRGIELAKGRYIARQDQDDIVLPGRLAKQCAFLDSHPEVAMVGTWAQIYVNKMATNRYHRHPTASDALRLRLLFDNPFVHSSMMIRTDVLRKVGGYCEDKLRQPPEDYELWSRIAQKYPVANLPEVLTIYREMPASMSRSNENPFFHKVLKISSENLYALLEPEYDEDACMSLACLYHNAPKAPRSLKKNEAIAMLNKAVKRFADNGTPSAEFTAEANRLQAHIRSRFIRRHISNSLLRPARWIRNCILGRGGR